MELREGLSDAHVDAFFDRWIDAIEARGLSFGGGGDDRTLRGFVTRSGRGSATDEDRASLAALLESDELVVGHDISELRDAWYDWD